MADLFEHAQSQKEHHKRKQENPECLRPLPLAHRMRPTRLDEFAGQKHIVGPGKPLRNWIESDRVPSIILWGPPGCGKTTLARIIAEHTQHRFVSLSAVLSGVKDIKESIAQAKMLRENRGQGTLLFVDEIHRFNKAQQDALLPHVENGTVTLIGATTENPSFEVNAALLSRTRVLRLKEIPSEEIARVIERALNDSGKGLSSLLKLEPEAIQWLAQIAEGDARRALTALENISLAAGGNENALTQEETQKALESAEERQPIRYDKNGEEHYNTISAFIKSIRDSDPHAGLYYLARMLEAGEDPKFIVRRLIILASEDIGNADPRALQLAVATQQAIHFVGMPECRINLGQLVSYLALAPKSNAAYQGIEAALQTVRQTGALSIPMHLRNAVTGLMKNQGYGKNYQYAHNSQTAEVKQRHLPEELKGKRFYHPKDVGLEKALKEKLDRINPNFDV